MGIGGREGEGEGEGGGRRGREGRDEDRCNSSEYLESVGFL